MVGKECGGFFQHFFCDGLLLGGCGVGGELYQSCGSIFVRRNFLRELASGGKLALIGGIPSGLPDCLLDDLFTLKWIGQSVGHLTCLLQVAVICKLPCDLLHHVGTDIGGCLFGDREELVRISTGLRLAKLIPRLLLRGQRAYVLIHLLAQSLGMAGSKLLQVFDRALQARDRCRRKVWAESSRGNRVSQRLEALIGSPAVAERVCLGVEEIESKVE